MSTHKRRKGKRPSASNNLHEALELVAASVTETEELIVDEAAPTAAATSEAAETSGAATSGATAATTPRRVRSNEERRAPQLNRLSLTSLSRSGRSSCSRDEPWVNISMPSSDSDDSELDAAFSSMSLESIDEHGQLCGRRRTPNNYLATIREESEDASFLQQSLSSSMRSAASTSIVSRITPAIVAASQPQPPPLAWRRSADGLLGRRHPFSTKGAGADAFNSALNKK